MSAPTEPAPGVPVTQQRAFWVLMGYAVALGFSAHSRVWCSWA
jgi:hypothetical protein